MNKNRVFLTLAFATSLWIQLLAQPSLDWVATIDAHAPTSLPTKMAMDATGNVYITGYFKGTVDFDPGVGVFELSVPVTGITPIPYILKLDQNRNFLWVKTITDLGVYFPLPITIDPEGNALIGGVFDGTVDFDPGNDTFVVISGGSRTDGFLLKLDPDGNFLWVKTMVSGSNYFGGNNVLALVSDESGAVYLTGWLTDTVDFDPDTAVYNGVVPSGSADAYLLKLDQDGHFQWVKTIGGLDAGCYGYSITSGHSGKLYLTGEFSHKVDFDPGPGVFYMTANISTTWPDRSAYNTFICQFDSVGNFGWAKRLAAGFDNGGYAVVVDEMDNVYVAGDFYGKTDFDPGPDTFNVTASHTETYVLKLSLEGVFIWVRTLQGQMGSAVPGVGALSIDPVGGIMVGGSFYGTVDFDPGPDSLIFISAGLQPVNPPPDGFPDGFLWHLDPNGALVAAYQLGYIWYDKVYCVQWANGTVCLSGTLTGSADMDPSTDTFELDMSGFYIARWVFPSLGVHFSGDELKVEIYPNPFREEISVYSDLLYTGPINIRVYDVGGRLVYEKSQKLLDQVSIPVKGPSGIYWVHLQAPDGTHVAHKVIKQ